MKQSLSLNRFPVFAPQLSGRVIEPARCRLRAGAHDISRWIRSASSAHRPAGGCGRRGTCHHARTRDGAAALPIRSGGHSGAGYSTVDGGIVLDVRDMKTLDIDPMAALRGPRLA